MKLEQYIKDIEQFLKDYLNDSHMEKYILGISGGVDSSLCAVLAKNAVGKERLHCVIIPIESLPEDEEDALKLASEYDLNYTIIDASESFREHVKEFQRNGLELDKSTLGNLKARMRMSILYAIAQHFYLRFGRYALPIINDEKTYKFELGKGVLLAGGTDVTIVATGLMVSVALEARELLAAEGISARVINIHTIKPLDGDILAKAARETGAIVTAEEHNVIGGLGSAVAESVAESCPVPVVRVGVKDTYGHSGTVPALLEAYGLTAANVVAAAKSAIAKKG